MKLAIIADYLHAISQLLLHELHRPDNHTANIYLATEDPNALRDFVAAAPPGWTIYFDRTLCNNQFDPSCWDGFRKSRDVAVSIIARPRISTVFESSRNFLPMPPRGQPASFPQAL